MMIIFYLSNICANPAKTTAGVRQNILFTIFAIKTHNFREFVANFVVVFINLLSVEICDETSK
jgi:hypothetical protein